MSETLLKTIDAADDANLGQALLRLARLAESVAMYETAAESFQHEPKDFLRVDGTDPESDSFKCETTSPTHTQDIWDVTVIDAFDGCRVDDALALLAETQPPIYKEVSR